MTLVLDDTPAVKVGRADRSIILGVPGIHCAGCVSRIETGLADTQNFGSARVNVTRKTVEVWPRDTTRPIPTWRLEADAIEALAEIGFEATPMGGAVDGDPQGRMLVRALAVAGFASMNVMLLSVSIWAGADGTTRTLLHWLSAMIAVPAVIYAGRPFFYSAWSALKTRSVNMDVPITLAVVLACGLSLYQTMLGEAAAYFDAAVMLLFFLLAGRTLDHYARRRMKSSLAQVASLMPRTAFVVTGETGRGKTVRAKTVRECALETVEAGATIRVRAGDRVPLDIRISRRGSFDLSHVTGEMDPALLDAGEEVAAGAIALEGPQDALVLRPAADSFVMRLADLLRTAEAVRPHHLALADRAAAFYTPVVHLVAFLAAAGWLLSGAGWHQAITVAVATLIITCPCALGLAVPAVQTVAFDVLYRNGIIAKDGAALERLRDVDTVLLDKTGTLTVPQAGANLCDTDCSVAAALATHSSHPLAKAIVLEARRRLLDLPALTDVEETVGAGVVGQRDGTTVRLGSAQFVNADDEGTLFLRIGTEAAIAVGVDERIREGAEDLVTRFLGLGMKVLMVTGDRHARAHNVATTLGIDVQAELKPDAKLDIIKSMTASGARILMIGDGVNDGPALAAAHVSMAPGAATDLSRTTADLVLLGQDLGGAELALDVAFATRRHILQNFSVAFIYNLFAVPLAVLGIATPLHAAIAMSTSSILVTLNALRLRWAVAGSAVRRAP